MRANHMYVNCITSQTFDMIPKPFHQIYGPYYTYDTLWVKTYNV